MTFRILSQNRNALKKLTTFKPVNRYHRQIILPGFGIEAQSKLASSHVLVIGAGGLGSPALQYLAAAGVGSITIADGDTVSLHNLQRQTLFHEGVIGHNKALAASEILQKLNSEINIQTIPAFLTTESIQSAIQAADVVLDCTDNLEIRYEINDACCQHQTPLVYAALYQFEGQLSVFHYGKDPFDLRDVYPDISANSVISCDIGGILGTVPAILGIMQANEAIKIICNIGEACSGKLLLINMLDYQQHSFTLQKRSKTLITSSIKDAPSQSESDAAIKEVSSLSQLQNLIASGAILVDVREEFEQPRISSIPHHSIPNSRFQSESESLSTASALIFICAAGKRSEYIAQNYKQQHPEKEIYTVPQGVSILSTKESD
ncbi:MAG: HesA/MoeB/ThiF family protein [Weeksellaceae bacterium]|nr:HesA/MoeB/ThiF family protein [Weeksellaceae bacterium]